MTRHTVAPLVIVLGGLAGVGSAWLPWTLSGSAERNSYESLRSAQRLGIEQLTPYRVVWFLVPVAVLATIILLVSRLDRAAGIVGFGTGVVLMAFGGGILVTPVAAGPGPWLSCGAGLVTAAASCALIAQGGQRS